MKTNHFSVFSFIKMGLYYIYKGKRVSHPPAIIIIIII